MSQTALTSRTVVKPRTTVRVLLAENHTLVRHATRAALNADPLLMVVGEADCLQDALHCIEDTRPDIVLIDVRLRQSSGIDLARAIRHHHPHIKTLALSAYGLSQYAKAMAKAGASAYLLKTVSPLELRQVIHDAYEGKLADWSDSIPRERPVRKNRYHFLSPRRRGLTPREVEVLEVANASGNIAAAAHQLNLSKKTIYIHLARIQAKLRETLSASSQGRLE